MAFRDLREFLECLDREGELARISEEVDWRYEIAAFTRLSYDMKPRGPALLFEKIKGYGQGYQVLTNGIGSYSRLALALGLPAHTLVKELIDSFKQRITTPLPPRMVNDGPVKENVILGQEVNLLKFPVPWWTPLDAGRYLGTWHANVSKNAETGVTNLGLYRMQVFDARHAGVGFLPRTHLGLHHSQREERNEPLEMAVVIGCDEAVIMAAMTGVPEPVDEYALAGGLRGEPLELVKCETVDLYVPAFAEIVLEGRILPHVRQPEGPFGEHTGYHGGGVRMRPVFEVTAITHRDQPIFRGHLCGKPVVESHIAFSIIASAGGLAAFERAGPPGVKAIFCPPQGDPVLSAVIQMAPYYVGHSRDVGRFWFSGTGGQQEKYVVIVDEDIDPFDLSQVWWAITTRTWASRDLEVLPFGRISRSDPSASRQGEFTDYLIIDATKKLDYPYVKAYDGHWAPVCMPPQEAMNLVGLKWRRLVKGEPIPEEVMARLASHLEALEKEWEPFRKDRYVLSQPDQEEERPRSYPRISSRS